jgi:hypothetical protein
MATHSENALVPCTHRATALGQRDPVLTGQKDDYAADKRQTQC